MLVLPQTVNVKWNGRNKKWYIKKGYAFTNFGDEFEVNILDLPLNSKQHIKVFCDSCNKITLKEYRVCIGRRKINKDYCDKCKIKKKYTFDDIKKEFEKRNFTLLETEYLGYSKNHKYICNNGHESSILFNNLLKGEGCKICASKKLANERKKSTDEVKKIFEENGCILLTEEYVNNKQKLEYVCECGNKSKISLSHFLKGQRCKKCGDRKTREAELKYNIQDVINIFKKYNCILLEDQYINFNTPMNFICACGNKSKKTLNKFLKQPHCKDCSFEKIRGENNWNWNPNLTDEEREKGRNIDGYEHWRQEVYKRDNYTCQCCEKRGCKLNAHHLDGYHWCKEKRLDVDNGITLCSDCHQDFHHQYGIKNNTKEQFEEWINNK